MSRVIVIGATGHIGSYLVPRLVRGGHEVIAMSRGARDPYHPSPQWGSVSRITVDRDAEDEQGTFGARIAALRPDMVIDLICFTAASARQLVDALRPSRPLLIHVHRCRTGAGWRPLRTVVAIEGVFAVLALESEPKDPRLPRLQSPRLAGELCFFTEQLTELDGQLSMLAFRFVLPGQSHLSEIVPPHLPRSGRLPPKLFC